MGKNQGTWPAKKKVNHWAHLVLFHIPVSPELNAEELFHACSAQERKIRNVNFREALENRYRAYLFTFPLFDDSSDWGNEGYPLQFKIGRPKAETAPGDGWRYAELLRYLKQLDDPELRLLLVARWLFAEGVCPPEEVLPPPLLKRILKRVRSRMLDLSAKNLYHWRLVKIWLPYFEALLADRKKDPNGDLVAKGYEPHAVRQSEGKLKAVPAVASWLELRDSLRGRKPLDAHKLEKAYSSVEVLIRRELERIEPDPLG